MAPASPLFQKPPATSPIPPAQPVFDNRTEPPQSSLPTPPSAPSPLLRLHLDALGHEATRAFLSAVDPTSLLKEAIETVLKWLYDFPNPHRRAPSADTASSASGEPATPWPPVRSATLVLRPMSGVAYTTSIRIDDAHKEIHLSLDYLANAAQSDRLRDEITGVIVHEMVHVWQSYAEGSAPGGLTEGIADWVRLRAGLAPPHWKRQAGADGRAWDDGYETTGWFLEWLESVRVGAGTVRRANATLRDKEYDEKTFWKEVCGEHVEVLWSEYGEWLKKEDKDEGTQG